MEEKQTNNTKRVIVTVVKVILVLWGILWGVGNLASILIPYKQFVDTASQALNTSSQTVSTTAGETSRAGILEDIFHASFKPFLVLSTVSVILGIVVLYNGRTFLEMIYMFDVFTIPRQRKYWGSVFDLKTHAPISLASITLFEVTNGQEKLVQRSVSDLDGHYRIRIPDLNKKYSIEVKALDYKPLKKEVDNAVKSIVNRGELLEDIVLTKISEQSSSLASTFYRLRPRLYNALFIYLFVLSALGFVLYLYQASVKPGYDTYGGVIFFGIGVVWNIFIVTERTRARVGRILDQDHKPIVGASVRIYKEGRQIGSVLSGNDGVVKIEFGPGVYNIKIDKEGYANLRNEQEAFLLARVTNDGYLSRDFILQRTGKEIANKTDNSVLASPF